MTHDKVNEDSDLTPHLVKIINELIDREMNQSDRIELRAEEVEKIQGRLNAT